VRDQELLAEFTRILNQFGPDSPEEAAFLNRYAANQELVELATLASTLKRALMKKPDLKDSRKPAQSVRGVARSSSGKPADPKQ